MFQSTAWDSFCPARNVHSSRTCCSSWKSTVLAPKRTITPKGSCKSGGATVWADTQGSRHARTAAARSSSASSGPLRGEARDGCFDSKHVLSFRRVKTPHQQEPETRGAIGERRQVRQHSRRGVPLSARAPSCPPCEGKVSHPLSTILWGRQLGAPSAPPDDAPAA